MAFHNFVPYKLAIVGPFHSGRRELAAYLQRQYGAFTHHHLVVDSICTNALTKQHHPLIVTTLSKKLFNAKYYDTLKSHNISVIEVHRKWWTQPTPLGPADALIANVGSLTQLHSKIDRLIPSEVKAHCYTQNEVKALWEKSFGGTQQQSLFG